MAQAGGWSKEWRRAGAWALSTLENDLGRDWPGRTLAKFDELPGELGLCSSHAFAHLEVLTLALRLHLLRDVPGIARVRKTLRGSPVRGSWAHTRLQLEVASLGLQGGRDVELEPTQIGFGTPADVRLGATVIETAALLRDDVSLNAGRRIDELFNAIREIESEYDVIVAGSVDPRVVELEDLLRGLRGLAALVANGGVAPRLGVPGAALSVSRSAAPGASLSANVPQVDLMRRLTARLHSKRLQAQSSGAQWLRVDAMDVLWRLTPWARASLNQKLQMLVDALKPHDRVGLVLTDGAVLADVSTRPETVLAQAGDALRRRLDPFRVRETFVFGAASSTERQDWAELYDAEPRWLQRALDAVSLDPVPEFAAPRVEGSGPIGTATETSS